MDFCRNISVSGDEFPYEYQPEQLLSSSIKLGSLDDLFSSHNMQEGDTGLEWLSIYVEDCFSSSGNCLPPAPAVPTNPEPQKSITFIGNESISKDSNPLPFGKTHQKYSASCSSSMRRARSKRKRGSSVTQSKTQLSYWSHYRHNLQLHQNSSDPPLLHQAYWLADSELVLPKKKRENGGEGEGGANEMGMGSGVSLDGINGQTHGQQSRRCSHCLSQRTPQWRAGPKGPKTLCNACGVRYKSGRLLPEYRPAKSPTFVSYKHSNSHRKVLEMRNNMSLLLSSSHS